MNPVYVPLLVGSMLVNYLLGGYLRQHPSRLVLGLAVAANVLLLVYYKYTGFLLGTLDAALDLGWRVEDIILPLAISFFTFQQIAYLVDAHDGVVEEHDFANYCLFISFFPQLIAGPITHHGEMLAQFNDRDSFRARIDNLSLGATVFLLGLFKKVVIADTLALKATPVFSLAADGTMPAFYDAWTGALTYTLQIYFDFSGYSDMAIGLALLFGISLPANFNSPFKARNGHRLLVALAHDVDAFSHGLHLQPYRAARDPRAHGGRQAAAATGQDDRRHLLRTGCLPHRVHHVHLRHLARRRLALRRLRPAARFLLWWSPTAGVPGRHVRAGSWTATSGGTRPRPSR